MPSVSRGHEFQMFAAQKSEEEEAFVSRSITFCKLEEACTKHRKAVVGLDITCHVVFLGFRLLSEKFFATVSSFTVSVLLCKKEKGVKLKF